MAAKWYVVRTYSGHENKVKQFLESDLEENEHLKAKIEGEFAPIAGNINPVDDGLTVEASFVGKINDKEAKILVTASFDQEGKLSEFICNSVS